MLLYIVPTVVDSMMCMYTVLAVTIPPGHISLGALGDSFYEYLIKSWLVTSKKDTDGLDMFTSAVAVSLP